MKLSRKMRLLCCLPTLAASAFFLPGCNEDTEKTPDTSAIKLTLKTRRFDTDLYALDTNNLGEGLRALQQKYPTFLDYFLDTLMAYGIHGNYADTTAGVRDGLRPFLAYKDYKELEEYIKKQYPDTRKTDEQLTKSFTLLKYYLPSSRTPEIIYLNMGLSRWPSFPVDSATFCIGLDMFLGDDFPHYTSIGEPDYLKAHHRESYIPVSVFTSIYRSAWPMQTQEKNLLELMLHRGREKYFVHKMMPGIPDSVLFGFRQHQMEWCHKNEAYTYNFFVKNELLYSKEAQNIMPYVTEGPFARGMEPASEGIKMTPGNIGSWLGYRMITEYMNKHPEVTLAQLLQKQFDPATFLAEAKYKPR